MSQNVNIIITCDRKNCPYCHEGECGKETLYIEDSECEVLAKQAE